MSSEPSDKKTPIIDELIQITLWEYNCSTIETVNGRVKWEDWLNNKAAEMKKHGRQVEIRRITRRKSDGHGTGNGRQKEKRALFANPVAPYYHW